MVPSRRSTGNPARALARAPHLLKMTVQGCLISERFPVPTVAAPNRDFAGGAPSYRLRDVRPSRPGWTSPDANVEAAPVATVIRPPISIDEETA